MLPWLLLITSNLPLNHVKALSFDHEKLDSQFSAYSYGWRGLLFIVVVAITTLVVVGRINEFICQHCCSFV